MKNDPCWEAIVDAWRSRAETARRWAREAAKDGRISDSLRLMSIAEHHEDVADRYQEIADKEKASEP